METLQKHSLTEPDFNYSGNYTYADYLRWTIEERIELIRGKIFRMSPAPSSNHQTILNNINGPLWSFLKNQPCQVFVAPFDVRFPRKSKQDNDIVTVLQPDLCVICDPSKIDARGGIGAPDLIIEILSPGNSKKEMRLKYEVYEESGVKEYWVVDGERKVCHLFLLEDGQYKACRPFVEGDVLESRVLPGFKIPVDEVFFRKFGEKE